MVIRLSSSTSGESFTVITSTGGTKTATLTRTFPAGTYLIESKAMDTNLEIYLGASDGTQVGTSAAGAKSITASAAFLYVTTINADVNDAITFTLKSAATLATKTDAVWAPPTITDITPSGLPNANDTTTITGTNFATNVDVKFRKSDDSTLVNAKTTIRGSATSIIAGRPDTFSPTDAPYDVIVTNPSTNLSATSLNAITAGAVPVWVTSTTLNVATIDSAFSQTISATDSDGGSSVTYAIVSGSFHSGLSFNTNTGAITGTPTGSASTDTITISATDSGGNTVNRTFTQVVNPANLIIDYLVVAGGGGGGGGWGGGGGAGGLRSTVNSTGGNGTLESQVTLPLDTAFSILVGSGGQGGLAGSSRGGYNYGTPGNLGTNSSIFGTGITTITSIGGGYGGSESFPPGASGGSGGGSSSVVSVSTYGQAAGSASLSGQGFAGGIGFNGGAGYGAGGGGGAGAAGSNGSTNGGSGGNGVYVSISGSSIAYAGGGGGGCVDAGTGGAGGIGGGGSGTRTDLYASNGTLNTGGGGGGGGHIGGGGNQGFGGNGGSGIVVISYSGLQRATGGTVTTSGGKTIHTFTSSGTFYSGIPSGSAKATGGLISTNGTHWIHKFDSNGTFTPTQNITNVDYLVVAGGGAGGGWVGAGGGGASGGGGAGGVRCTVDNTGRLATLPSKISLNSGTNYTITIGGGGSSGNGTGSSLSGSGLSTISTSGGGAGGTRTTTSAQAGGSGGGGYGDGTTNVGGAGTTAEGFNGGSGSGVDGGSSGGGGGAGAAGENGFRDSSSGDWYAGDGGNGIQTSISGTSIYYAGGGGGGSAPQNSGWLAAPNGAGAGGLGGGGRGAQSMPNGQNSEPGTPNTGGGGGGRDNDSQFPGKSGGSGIVIIRYPV